MTGRASRVCIACLVGSAGGLLGIGALLLSAGPASADVIAPSGACSARGTFTSIGATETSIGHTPSDVVKIPQADTVKWEGNERGYAVGSNGPRRAIDGAVTLELPIGSATIWNWGGTSTRYANEGNESYHLPSVLDNVKLNLSGYQKDAGRTTCSGSVYLEVATSTFSNPLTYGSIAGMVIFGSLLLFAGKPVYKKNWAYDDIDG